MTVGEKIKALRKKRGVTQIALAKDLISRSMLSRIESGTAEPSLSTLRALAERLDIDAGFLLDENDDTLPLERAAFEKLITSAFANENYKECVSILEKTDLLYESSYLGMFAYSAFRIALAEFFAGNFSASKEMLSKTEALIDKLHLSLTELRTERIYVMRQIMENIQNIEELPADVCPAPDFDFQPSLFLFLLGLLKCGRHKDCTLLLEFCKLDEPYMEYLDAQMLIKEYKFIDALFRLKTIVNDDVSPFFLKIISLRSIENCCKLCEDYKGAYETHLKLSELLNKII